MVTALLEVEKGVEGLWKRGESVGMKEFPNYGQYISQNKFWAFLHGLPYIWTENKYCNVNKGILPFDLIAHFMNELMSYTSCRKGVCLVGGPRRVGLPHLTHEPR